MGFIFESEIDTIVNTVRARTIGENDTVRMRDIHRAEVHPAIKAYFLYEVEKLLDEERKNEQRSGKFSYGLPEVISLHRQIDSILIKQYQFDREEFENLLDQSVHFAFNYLCRPQWTLLNFIFEEQRRVTVSHLYRKLRYCVDYSYFPKTIQRFMNERGLAEIEYQEFKEVVGKIDAHITSLHSSRELAELLRPLIRFLEAGIPTPLFSGSILPINAAIVFFEDKDLTDIRNELEVERDHNKVEKVTVEELAVMIAHARGESEEGILEIDERKPQPDEDRFVESPVTMEETGAPEEEQRGEPESVADEEGTTDHGSLSPESMTVSSPEVEALHQPTKEAVQELPDVYALVPLNQQKLFVRKIFNKDEVEFRNVLDRLNRSESWDEASVILDEVFEQQNVDPYSKAAILFTNTINSRYLPLGEEGKEE